MDLIPSLLNAFVVVAMGALIAFVTRSRFQDLKSEVHDFKSEFRDFQKEVKDEFRDLRSEMNQRFRDQGTEIAALRSDVTQLALAIGTRPRPETA